LWTPAEFATMRRLGLFAGRAVSLDSGVVVEHRPGDPNPVPVVFTQTEYHALWNAQVFRDQRVQLVRGAIVQEPPLNPPHATGVRKTARALERVFATDHDVRPQLPLDLAPVFEPHPDVAVVPGSVEDYATVHPTTAVLVVEVADESLAGDTSTKAEDYATAGIAEYWVLDLNGRRLLVLRDPGPLAVGLGVTAYRTHLTFGENDTVSPLAAPNAVVKVADLLP
jgi:Uma2 family endonuclease